MVISRVVWFQNWALSVVAGACALGCSAAPTGTGAPTALGGGGQPEGIASSTTGASEHVGTTAQALSNCPNCSSGITEYFWNQGQAQVTMIPTNQGICGLVGVGGQFRGWNEWVRVDIVGANWVLGGASNQQGVWGEARCVASWVFNTSNGIAWSGDWWNFFTSQYSGVSISQTDLWGPNNPPADSQCWLNGFGGDFGGVPIRNGTSSVSISFNGNWPDPLLTLVGGTDNQPMRGWAACMAVNYASRTKTFGNWDGQVYLTDGICFLQDVHGRFLSAQDSVWIARTGGSGYQRLHYTGTGWGGSAFGAVTCIPFNQR